MTVEKSETGDAEYKYTHDLQINYKRQLDQLKQDFTLQYNNPRSYSKKVEDFDQIKTLGAGAFGTVLLVRDTSTFQYHAMKAIDKAEVMKKKSLKHVLTEKRILQSVNFPFVSALDFISKDNAFVYFILPYEAGGELYMLMKRLGALAEELAQFYAAQIVLALEYLHHCCIVHRDVKPENILINESGFIKLCDLGFCKVIKTRTWTICGTPEYLAPEVILSKGYSFAVDWWAVGVLIYEMQAGYPPFYSSDTMKLYEKILSGYFKAPESVSMPCKSLLKHLLEVDPMKRFGSLKSGVFDIKSHPWFSDTNWYSIYHQKVFPPFMPICKNAGDSSNFREMNDVLLKKASKCLFEKEFENF